MLIKCPECGTQVSNKAQQCIHCGAPIAEPAHAARPAAHANVAQVQTIEQTGKEWKGQQLVGALIAIVGIVFAAGGSTVGGYAVGIGFVWFLVARMAGWWHHG